MREGSNFHNLTYTQNELDSFIEEHIAAIQSPSKQEVEARCSSRNKDIQKELREQLSFRVLCHDSDKAFAQAIDLLRERRDLGLNIVWSRKKDTHGNRYLIRDARYAKSAEETDSQTAYQIQFLNLARATIKLLELEKQHCTDKHRKKEIESCIDTIKYKVSHQRLDQVDLAVLSQAKDSFVKILSIFNIKNPEEALNVAKDFVAMDDTQYNIATLSRSSYKNKSTLVIECNNLLSGLTKSQKQQYQDIADGHIDHTINPGKSINSTYCSWYKLLPETERRLVAHYAPRIANGSIKILPTQLLKQLIGMRNGYCRSTATIDMQSSKPFVASKEKRMFKPTITSYHCGTLSFLGSGNAQEVTNENIRQARSFLPDQRQKVSLNALNSPRWGQEKRIVALLVKGAEKTGQACSVTPVNAWRGWLSNKNDGYSGYINLLANHLSKDHDPQVSATAKYLKSGREEDRRAALKLIGENPGKLSQELRHAIEAKRLIDYSNSIIGRLSMALYDPENTNLQLTARMGLVEAAIENGDIGKRLGEENRKNFDKIIVKCKSGKDRTGGTEFLKAVYVVCDALGIDSTNKKVMQSKEVIMSVVKPLVDAQHTQTLTAVNGGTPGAYGIKKEGIPKIADSFLPKSWRKQLKGLEQHTAKMNTISKYKKASKPDREYIREADFIAATHTPKGPHKKPGRHKSTTTRSPTFEDKEKMRKKSERHIDSGIL